MPFETKCSDVCDAVVYPLKELGIDVYKNGSDYDLDLDKVVKALQDDVVLTKRMTDFTREELLGHLGEMLTQVVILCNHLKGGVNPQVNYVTEKLSTYPIPDPRNQAVLDSILKILEVRYGVKLQHRSWG